MISENVTLLGRVKSCQAECPVSFSLSVLESKPFSERSIRLKLIGHGLGHLINGVRFFWEQIRDGWCLTERLSGNRQRQSAAPIPAPGGTQ
jgi:hypothetical protein